MRPSTEKPSTYELFKSIELLALNAASYRYTAQTDQLVRCYARSMNRIADQLQREI